jgi:hypothetical protein
MSRRGPVGEKRGLDVEKSDMGVDTEKGERNYEKTDHGTEKLATAAAASSNPLTLLPPPDGPDARLPLHDTERRRARRILVRSLAPPRTAHDFLGLLVVCRRSASCP